MLREEQGGEDVSLPHQQPPPLGDIREYVKQSLAAMRPDHLRAVNPTPYKVSVSTKLYSFLHELWSKELPVPHIE